MAPKKTPLEKLEAKVARLEAQLIEAKKTPWGRQDRRLKLRLRQARQLMREARV